MSYVELNLIHHLMLGSRFLLIRTTVSVKYYNLSVMFTLSILKVMMEVQDKAYKFTDKTFSDEIKAEIKEIREEVEELKLSVKFVSISHDDFKTRLGTIDDEIRGIYLQVEGLNNNLNDGLEDLELET